MHTTHQSAIDQLQATISDLKVFKTKELKELFLKYNKWKSNTRNSSKKQRREGKEAHRLIILHNLKLVVKIAHQYKYAGMEPEDLINEGTMGLIDAVDRFDVNNGAKFSTYAALWIKQKIRRCLSNKSRTIRIPDHLAQVKIGKIKTFVSEYKDKFGSEPSVDDIYKGIKKGVSKKAINDLVNGGVVNLKSIDTPLGDESDADTFGDVLEDNSMTSPDKATNFNDNVKHLTFYINKLKGREKHIIRRRFGLGGKRPETLEDIAKSYGLSRERIRQIQYAAMRKLKYVMGKHYGENFFLPER